MPRLLRYLLIIGCSLPGLILAEEKTEHFDRDPGWEARNNRNTTTSVRMVKQDFGYAATRKIGGIISPAAEPAYYGKKTATYTFANKLTASGTLELSGQSGHFLLGFFNAGTLNEWRTPNTINLRFSQRGDVFYAWLEYCTGRWRAGGDDPKSFPMETDAQTGRQRPKGFPIQGVHQWRLEYDPQGNQGKGVVTAEIDGATAICNVADGHKADGASCNRFGLLNVMKSADDGAECWLGSVTINGVAENLSSDPRWEGKNNRLIYDSTNVRPRFDFGYAQTNHAGGQRPGELGGLIFRGDCRYPDRMASYADRLEMLTLDQPLRAGGKIALRRGVTDSSVLFGFFHAEESMAVTQAQDQGLPASFLGISTDGPSREGFLFTPTYRLHGDARGYANNNQLRLFPDGKSRDWSLAYDPSGAGGRGEITVTLDKAAVRLPLAEGHKQAATRFNRFGIVTTWVDGNGQHLYLDDLTYTFRQPAK